MEFHDDEEEETDDGGSLVSVDWVEEERRLKRN